MFAHKPFILASSSKSRRKVLQTIKLNFKTKKPSCDEEHLKKKLRSSKTKPLNVVKSLAREKAKSVGKKHKKKLVIGCDTAIIFNNKLISKARNKKEAFVKIKKLSGKNHKIISAISVFKNNKEIWSCHQLSVVKIRKLKDLEIKNYINKSGRDILGSVGCYQAELLGPTIIEKITGDFFNVMGLPLFPFLNFLKKDSYKK